MLTAQAAPISIPLPSGDILVEMNREIPLQSTSEVVGKVEGQIDEGQLDHLATGVTVDNDDHTTFRLRVAVILLVHMTPFDVQTQNPGMKP